MAETKRGRRGRKAMKTLTLNDVNISARKISSSPIPPLAEAEKEETRDGLASTTLSPQKGKGKNIIPRSKASATTEKDLADELLELQGKLERLKLKMEKSDELLREQDEMLKLKEEEIENRGKEQERLQLELKKLQKLKEFKPCNIPLIMALREKEQEKKENKKNKKKKDKDCMEKKKPRPAYVLWCKDQWNEVKKENPDADFKEISNTLGAKWKTLSAEGKKPYEEKYQQEKEAYLQIVGQEKRQKRISVSANFMFLCHVLPFLSCYLSNLLPRNKVSNCQIFSTNGDGIDVYYLTDILVLFEQCCTPFLGEQ